MSGRWLRAGTFGAVALAIAAPAAAAHPRLVSASPRPQSVVTSAPREVRLQFLQPPLIAVSKVSVLDREGRNLVSGRLRLDQPDRARVIVPLRAGRRGVYTVHWQMVGADGHVVTGVYALASARSLASHRRRLDQGQGFARMQFARSTSSLSRWSGVDCSSSC